MRYSRFQAISKMAKDIAEGNGPLDRIEKFCRDNKIYSFCGFIDAAHDKAPDLFEWSEKSGCGVGARLRGIEARIAKVKREAGA